MSPSSSAQIVRSNPVRPQAIDATHLKQEILFRFAKILTPHPEMLFGWYASSYADIQSAFMEVLPSGVSESVTKIGSLHATLEVLESLEDSPLQN